MRERGNGIMGKWSNGMMGDKLTIYWNAGIME